MPAAPRNKKETSKSAAPDHRDSEVGARLRSICDARIPTKPRGRVPSDDEIAAHLGLGLAVTRAILRNGRLEGRALYRVRLAFPDVEPDWLLTGRKKENADPEESARARLAPSIHLSAERSHGREPLPESDRRPPLPYSYVRPGDKR